MYLQHPLEIRAAPFFFVVVQRTMELYYQEEARKVSQKGLRPDHPEALNVLSMQGSWLFTQVGVELEECTCRGSSCLLLLLLLLLLSSHEQQFSPRSPPLSALIQLDTTDSRGHRLYNLVQRP